MATTLYFLNNGNADIICIRITDNTSDKWIVVDAGSKSLEKNQLSLAQFLKSHGVKHLALLIITHFHEDHIGGLVEATKNLEAIEEYWGPELPREFKGVILPINTKWDRFTIKTAEAINAYSYFYFNLLPQIGKKCFIGGNVIPGLTWYGPEDSFISVIRSGFSQTWLLLELRHLAEAAAIKDNLAVKKHIENINSRLNETCIVLKMVQNGKSVLLVSDALNGWWLEEGICLNDLKATVLKLGHHGGLDATTPELVDLIKPQIAVCCATADDPNFPHPVVQKEFKRLGIPLLITGAEFQIQWISINWSKGKELEWKIIYKTKS